MFSLTAIKNEVIMNRVLWRSLRARQKRGKQPDRPSVQLAKKMEIIEFVNATRTLFVGVLCLMAPSSQTHFTQKLTRQINTAGSLEHTKPLALRVMKERHIHSTPIATFPVVWKLCSRVIA